MAALQSSVLGLMVILCRAIPRLFAELIASVLTRLAALSLALIRKSKFCKAALGARNNGALMNAETIDRIIKLVGLAILVTLHFTL